MTKTKCIAIVLAGGRGERLGALTHYYSKPALHFGGNKRIVDFALANCKNSGIETIAVLSQHFTTDLNEYIRSTYEGRTQGVYLLPSKSKSCPYNGTAGAVFQNLAFVDQFMPEHVLILASDHVYKMDYNRLLAFHEDMGADVTVSSTTVPIDEAAKFGIINADETGRVFAFEEKPRKPKSNLASMGIYVFKWKLLKNYLRMDNGRVHSKHDFGKDILPEILSGCQVYTYQFKGYWRDVGTVDKLWEANMDQLNNPCLRLPGSYVLPERVSLYGHARHSVLGDSVFVGLGSEIFNSVILPNAYIGSNAKIYNTIVGNHAVIRDGAIIGFEYGDDYFVDSRLCAGDVSLISPWADISEGVVLPKNSHVSKERLEAYYSAKNLPAFRSKSDNYAMV